MNQQRKAKVYDDWFTWRFGSVAPLCVWEFDQSAVPHSLDLDADRLPDEPGHSWIRENCLGPGHPAAAFHRIVDLLLCRQAKAKISVVAPARRHHERNVWDCFGI